MKIVKIYLNKEKTIFRIVKPFYEEIAGGKKHPNNCSVSMKQVADAFESVHFGFDVIEL